MSAALWRPVPPDRIPLYIKTSDPGGLDLNASCLDVWMLKDWRGLEEVTEVTEGIGMGGGDWKKFSHARAGGARRNVDFHVFS